jgi:hypothetical protein
MPTLLVAIWLVIFTVLGCRWIWHRRRRLYR